MAQYATLKAAIEAVIYENGNQEITGAIMQSTLIAMVNALGANYQFAGIATPATDPGTPDQNVFYLASTAGTYTNFSGIVLAENEVAILKGSGSTWVKDTTGFASAEALNAQIGQLKLILIDPNQYDFESGTISNSNVESANNKRVRSNYIPAKKNYIIACSDTYLFSLRYYDEKGTFLSSSGSWTTKIDLSTEAPSGTAQIRIVGRLASDGTVSDATSYNNYIHIYYNAVAFLAENVNLKEQMDNLFVQRLKYNLASVGYVLDCRPTSSRFGDISLPVNNWGTSQYVDVRNAKYIRIYRNLASTAGNPSYSGLCFYDKDRKPMAEGVARIIYGPNGTAFSDWTVHEVPDGAVWFRVSVSVTASTRMEYPIELYNLSPNEIVGMQAPNYDYQYFGDKIDLTSSPRPYQWRKIKGAIAANYQSAAIYGKYLFIVNNYLSSVMLFNMETWVTLYTYNTGFPTESILHCNQTQFGTAKYDAADMFPLLYTCTQNNEQGRCEWRAYRITPTITNDEISAFSMALVQTIYLPVMTDENALGNANPAFDYGNNCLWAYSRNNRAGADNYHRARFTKFAIPAIFDNNNQVISSVTLSDGDILDSFEAGFSMQYAQGGFISGGRLFIGQGGPSYPITAIRVIDLYAKRAQVSYFDLAHDGILDEPEGMFQYDGHIWMHTYGGVLWRFDL